MDEKKALAGLEFHKVSAEIARDRRIIRKLGKSLSKRQKAEKPVNDTLESLSWWQHNRAVAGQYARAYHLIKAFLRGRDYIKVEQTRYSDCPKYVVSAALNGILDSDEQILFYGWYSKRPPLIGIGHNKSELAA